MKPTHALIAGWTATLLGTAPCLAAGSTHLGTFHDWEAYSFSEKAGKVCYVASLPKSQQGAPKGRGSTFVSVTHRPGEKSQDVVSLDAGYAFKADSEVEVDIGAGKFKLFTKDDSAWAREQSTDKQLVEAMKKGKSLTVVGIPAKGGKTTDSYSLNGFAAAYAKIGEACGVK